MGITGFPPVSVRRGHDGSALAVRAVASDVESRPVASIDPGDTHRTFVPVSSNIGDNADRRVRQRRYPAPVGPFACSCACFREHVVPP